MANEKDKSDRAQKSVKIDDLPQSTSAGSSDKVKGGMIPRAGGGLGTDEDADEVGE